MTEEEVRDYILNNLRTDVVIENNFYAGRARHYIVFKFDGVEFGRISGEDILDLIRSGS